MPAQADIANDSPVIPYEIFPPLDVETQRASTLLKELESEEPGNFHIAPLGLSNFLYNAAHLFLPHFYSSRAYPVLSTATWTEQEIKSQFAKTTSKDSNVTLKHWPDVKQSWTDFLDSLSNEWKTLNLVSALLLTAIYNVLQLGGQGNNLTQCTALMSLLSALMSLLFGCLYLIRFKTMRRAYKAIQWSSDVLLTSQTAFWNIYILLSLPSVWLAWSLILFIICLMSIVWQPINETITSTSGIGPLKLSTQIAVSVLLSVGMVHLFLALFTFSRYGSKLDNTWRKKLESFSGAIPPDAGATSKRFDSEDSSPPNSLRLPYVAVEGSRRPTIDNGRPPYSHLQPSPYPFVPSPYVTTVGNRGPFDDGTPSIHLQPSPYSLLPSPYVTTIGNRGPFDDGTPPSIHLQPSPYPLLPSPYVTTVGNRGPFDDGTPPIRLQPPSIHLQPSPYPFLPSPPTRVEGPFDNNEPVNDSRPFNDSDRILNSTMAYPVPWTRFRPVRHGDFIPRPPSAP